MLLLCLFAPIMLEACASKYVTVRGVVERITPNAVMNATVLKVRAEYDHVYQVSVTPCDAAGSCDDQAAQLVKQLDKFDEVEFKAFYDSKTDTYVVMWPGYLKKLTAIER